VIETVYTLYLEDVLIGTWESVDWRHTIVLTETDPCIAEAPFSLVYEFKENGDFYSHYHF